MNTQHVNYDEHLAEHFTLREMVNSYLARTMHIDNTPTPEAVQNLRQLCQKVLEPLRQHFGPIGVNSGYRSPRLNELLGGVANSQHMKGQAADLYCRSLSDARRLFDYARQHVDFDQLLLERRFTDGCCWLHVSYVGTGRNRRMARFLRV